MENSYTTYTINHSHKYFPAFHECGCIFIVTSDEPKVLLQVIF